MAESEKYECLDCGQGFDVNLEMGDGKICPDESCASENVVPVDVDEDEILDEDEDDEDEDY